MKLYLDSADLDDVRRAMALGFVDGVTTNPSLIARTGRPGLGVLRDILGMTGGPVWYQVTADSVEGREAQAHEAAALERDRVQVKIPATTENFTLASRLVKQGLHCTLTAVASPAQAYLAALVGASYIAPYVNRLTRQLGDGIAVLRDCAAIVSGSQTQVLAASLKSVDEVVAAVLNGAQNITIPLDMILALGNHPLSQQAIDDFDAALKAVNLP